MNCLCFTFYFQIVFAIFIFVRFFFMVQNSSEIYSRTATAAVVALVGAPATYSTFNNIDLNGVSLISFNKVRVVYNVPCMEWERWS